MFVVAVNFYASKHRKANTVIGSAISLYTCIVTRILVGKLITRKTQYLKPLIFVLLIKLF